MAAWTEGEAGSEKWLDSGSLKGEQTDLLADWEWV